MASPGGLGPHMHIFEQLSAQISALSAHSPAAISHAEIAVFIQKLSSLIQILQGLQRRLHPGGPHETVEHASVSKVPSAAATEKEAKKKEELQRAIEKARSAGITIGLFEKTGPSDYATGIQDGVEWWIGTDDKSGWLKCKELYGPEAEKIHLGPVGEALFGENKIVAIRKKISRMNRLWTQVCKKAELWDEAADKSSYDGSEAHRERLLSAGKALDEARFDPQTKKRQTMDDWFAGFKGKERKKRRTCAD